MGGMGGMGGMGDSALPADAPPAFGEPPATDGAAENPEATTGDSALPPT